jgi:hypothetical protein
MTTYSEPGHLPAPDGGEAADGPSQIGALADRIAEILDPHTTAERDALAGDDLWTGRALWNSTTAAWEVYNGAAWVKAGTLDHAVLSNLTAGDPHTQYITKALLTANSIAKADASGVPEPLTVAEQRLVGRITGGEITALTAAQVQTLLDVLTTAAAAATYAPVGYAELTRTGTQAITTATFTSVQWDSEAVDSLGGHDNATNNTRYTAPAGKAGWYRVMFIADMDGLNDATAVSARIAKNGVAGRATTNNSGSGGATLTTIVEDLVNLAVGDYVEAQVWHNHGSNRNLSAQSAMIIRYLGA